MIESQWIAERQADQAHFIAASKKKRNLFLIIFAVVFVIALGAIFLNLEAEALTGSLTVVVPTFFIVMLVIFFSSRINTKAKPLLVLEDLAPYLTTPEEIALFEAEMTAKPKAEHLVRDGFGGCSYIVTNNWFAVRSTSGDNAYRVAKKEDVTFIHGSRVDGSSYSICISTRGDKVLDFVNPLDKKSYYKALLFLEEHFQDAEWRIYNKDMDKYRGKN